jgi:hypothetical protein
MLHLGIVRPDERGLITNPLGLAAVRLRPRPSEERFFGQVRLLYGVKRQGSGGHARQKCDSQGFEEQGGTQRQGPATCSVQPEGATQAQRTSNACRQPRWSRCPVSTWP